MLFFRIQVRILPLQSTNSECFFVDRTRNETVFFLNRKTLQLITALYQPRYMRICRSYWRLMNAFRNKASAYGTSRLVYIYHENERWVTASRQSISTCKCQKVVVVINKASCFILTSGCGPPVGTLSENSRSSISSLPTCRMFVWCIKCPSASDYTTVPHNLTPTRGGHRRMIFFLSSLCLLKV